MSLEISGKVVQFADEQSGESARGPWKKQEMIIETEEQYPKKVAVTLWGEKVDEAKKYQPGTRLNVSINIESREYNNRWYTDVKAWKIDVLNESGAASPSPEPMDAPAIDMDETDGDLPF